MQVNNRVARAGFVIALTWLMSACGGGGGGGSSETPAPGTPYANVQPAAAPAPETVNLAEASGLVATAADPLDASGRQAGVAVELNEVLAGGGLGPVLAQGLTGSGGSFRLVLPAGASAADGKWLLTARPAGGVLRAYVHAGAMRVDVGSEAWVQQVVAATGRLVAFTGTAAAPLKSVARSLALLSDATGDANTGLTRDAAVAKLTQRLQRDEAMQFVRSTLASTGTLPLNGVGDIGSFSALSATYAGSYTDAAGVATIVTLRPLFGAVKAADGSWSFVLTHYNSVNGQPGTVITGAGGSFRSTARQLFGVLPLSGDASLLSSVFGEFAQQSFPLQVGDRQLDARRVTATGLNFTGGREEQPASLSSIERVVGVESLVLASGNFRTVKVINEWEIALPTASGGVTRLTARSTTWLAPGAGVVRALDQFLVDGVLDTSTPDPVNTLQQAWADNQVWPNQITLLPNRMNGIAGSHLCTTAVPGTRRFVTVEAGPLVNSSPTLALALWDMDSGTQIGATRNFAGFSGGCPVAAGQTGSLLVTETFFVAQNATAWPASEAVAAAASDRIHQVSATDLQDLRVHALPAVPDTLQPTLYRPGVARFVGGAPDNSGSVVVGITQSDIFGGSGHTLFVQVLQPGGASPLRSLGRVQLMAADWAAGRLFTKEGVQPFTMRMTPFSAAGADPTGTVDITTGIQDGQVWFASASQVYLNDGSAIRLSDGGPGQALGFVRDRCGIGSGELVCLDPVNDLLVRFDPASGQRRGAVPLGSALRALSLGVDFRQVLSLLGGIHVIDATTFTVTGYDLHIGRW